MVTHFIFLVCIILSMPLSKNKQFNKVLYWISFALLFIFAAFRYGFGNDYFQYQKIYNAIQNPKAYNSHGLAEYYGKQVVFVFLNKISFNYYTFIGLTSLLFILTIALFIQKNVSANYRWLSLLVFLINPYLFLINLSAIRQCLAMILFIIAVNFAYKKKVIIYIVLILLASLCHSSAIVLLPIYFICNEKQVRNYGVIIITSLILILLLMPDMLDRVIMDVLNTMFENTTYNQYLEGNNSLRATILSSLFCIYLLVNIGGLKGKTLVFAKLYLLATIFNILAYRYSMLTRITMYFDIFSIIVLPLLFMNNLYSKKYVFRNYKGYENIYVAINTYVFPLLLIIIYFLRYYSFFNNTLWKSFWTYHTIFSVI